MDINSQIIFNTLKKQNILKSELKYKELVNSKLNILIKKKVNGQWMYYVDLWQSFFNLNTKYFEENNRPEWIEDILIDNQNGYSTEINDAAIYKNFKLFEEEIDGSLKAKINVSADYQNVNIELKAKEKGKEFIDFSFNSNTSSNRVE